MSFLISKRLKRKKEGKYLQEKNKEPYTPKKWDAKD